MKHILVAVAFLALPATALAQSVVCQACDHIAPYFRGEGGFIATVAEGVEEVVFVASCGNVTITGEVGPGAGTVAQLFTYRNGLACDGDDGSLEISGLEDGGWYWITDARNSAVGSLIRKDVLDNEPTGITDAGAGVSMTMGRGAVYLKELRTGRVGILPNILPEPPADAAVICGPRQNTSWPNAYDRQMTSSCMLGNGRTTIRLVGPGSFGSSATITNGMVYRPNSGTVTVTADLWLNETGSYSTATDNDDSTGPTAASIQKGWAGKTASAQGSGSGENWLTATFGLSVNATVGVPTVVPVDGSAAVAGVTLTNVGDTSTTSGRAGGDAPVGKAVFTVGPDSAYCSRTANHTAVVNVAAIPAAADATPTNEVHPAVATGRAAGLGSSAALASVGAITQLRIVCPPE